MERALIVAGDGSESRSLFMPKYIYIRFDGTTNIRRDGLFSAYSCNNRVFNNYEQ